MAQFHLKSQPVQAQPQHVCYTAPCLPTSIALPLISLSQNIHSSTLFSPSLSPSLPFLLNLPSTIPPPHFSAFLLLPVCLNALLFTIHHSLKLLDFFRNFITAEDYELTNSSLHLMPGNVRRDCVLITIKDDNEIEGMENFTVTATLIQSTIRTNMITIAPTEALVVIIDNDGTIIT